MSFLCLYSGRCKAVKSKETKGNSWSDTPGAFCLQWDGQGWRSWRKIQFAGTLHLKFTCWSNMYIVQSVTQCWRTNIPYKFSAIELYVLLIMVSVHISKNILFSFLLLGSLSSDFRWGECCSLIVIQTMQDFVGWSCGSRTHQLD